MNISLEKENFKSASFLRRVYSETPVEGEVIVPDYYPGIMRVVKTEAIPYIRSKEIRESKVYIEGNVCFRVLYICESGKINGYSTAIPFSQNIDIKTDTIISCFVEAKTVYVNTRALNPQKLYFKANISVFADCIAETEQCVVKNSEESKNVFMQTDSIETFNVVCETQKPLRLTDDISVDSKNVNTILRYDSYIIETERKSVNGKIIVKGDLVLKILYTENETSEILTSTHKNSFSHILEMKDIDESCIFDIGYNISDMSVSLLSNSSETSSEITFDAEIFVTAVAYKNKKQTVCLDAFSTDKELDISTSEMIAQNICNVKKEISVRQSADIGEYTKVHDISVLPEIENADYYTENGSMNIKGSMVCTVFFTDTEGDFTTCERKIPFELQMPVKSGGAAAISKCIINLEACAFVEKDGSSIEIRMDAVCVGTVSVLNQKCVVTNAEITDSPVQQRNSGITIYYADKNENVFSIAKRYSVDPQILKTVNEINDVIDNKRAIII